MSEFKGTKGNFKEDIGIDLLGKDDELMQIIIYSEEINTHSVAHVFGLSKVEVMSNAKLFAKSKEMLEMLESLINEKRNMIHPALCNEIEQLIKQATEL